MTSVKLAPISIYFRSLDIMVPDCFAVFHVTVILTSLVVALIFITTTVFLLGKLLQSEIEVKQLSSVKELVYEELRFLPEHYKRRKQESNEDITNLFIYNVNLSEKVNNLSDLWNEADSWVSKTQLVDITNPHLGNVVFALKHAEIIKADLDTRGTQLKLLLTLEGGQQAVFKPKWYEKDKIIEGPVYAGKDRYGSEILAFYLSIVLNKLLTPICVERRISLSKHIVPVATKRLLNTSFQTTNNRTCVYGKCFYCKREDPMCENEQHLLIGALIFNIKGTFKNYRSPWQRTYKKNKQAPWEQSDDYCMNVRIKLSKQRLYDLIDAAIFDYLIQNGDRHHYETLNDTLILLDNGKGLGNPHVDHFDILAPLYQCCMIRRSTWQRLNSLTGGVIRQKLEKMPDVNNFVSQEHLNAIEDRLLMVFATIEYCRKKQLIKKT